MATKILGDDPFAAAGAGGEEQPKVVEEKAAKLRKKPPKKKKEEGEVAVKAKAKKTAAPPPPPPDPPTGTGTGTESPTVEETASGYGPSIDQEESAGQIRQVIDHVREIERQVRERFGAPEPRRRVPLEFLWKRYREVAMRDRSDVVDEFGRDPSVAARIDPLLDFLYKRYFRVDAEGMGHIPDAGRALIVANHSGTLPYDGAMIMHAVQKDHPAQRPVRPLVEDFVFHFPYLGTLMNRIGGVRACQENAERLLAQDQLVAVFPEGIKGVGKLFAQRYQLQRFGRGGFIKLALATDSPIIPTAVVGAEEIHPMVTKITWLAKSIGIPYIPITPTFPLLGPLGLLPLPTKWYLAFGEPLYFNAEYGSEAAGDRILVNKLAEQVRQRIQEMIDSLLAKRRSVLIG
jgi:1-acyl-sn-glycerol-3-phosphate acyltransferase